MKTHPTLKTLALAAALAGSVGAAQAVEYQFHQRVKGLVVAQPAEPQVFSSCLDIKTQNPAAASGVHAITVGGKAFDVYCDMESAGGGWTMVVAQFEADPVTNWNEGIQADYDPSLVTRRGFALSSGEIPAHTETAFGKELDADFIDYVRFTYTTGEIPKTLVAGSKASYHVYRDSYYHYSGHDPESPLGTNGGVGMEWNWSLGFDETGGMKFTWDFSPLNSLSTHRGYSMSGQQLRYSNESHAWTVWVR
jgi:hypothetical protein